MPKDTVRYLSTALVLTLVAYAGCLLGTRVFDDFHSVFDNPPLRDAANVLRFFTDPSTFSIYRTSSFRPVTLTSYALTFAVFGGWLPAFHAGNLLIHLGCVCAIYFLFLSLLRLQGARRPGRAAMVGATVFGVHPAASQVVHYISSRAESLAFLGVSGALACHAWSLVLLASGARLVLLRGTTIFFVALAISSKETGILVLPLLVAVDLAVDPYRRGTMAARLFRLIGPAVLVGMYFAVRLAPSLIGPQSAAAPIAAVLPGRSFWLADSLRALWVYLQLSVAPTHLAMWRELPPSDDAFLTATLAGFGLCLLLGGSAVLLVRERGRMIGLAGLLYGVPFLPYLFNQLKLVVNENRMYPPLAGLALAAALLYAGPLCRWSAGNASRRRALGAVAFSLLLLAMARDWKASYTWASEVRIWQNAIAVSPFSGDLRAGLGTAYMRQERWKEGREEFLAAVHLPVSQLHVVYDNLAIASYELGDKDAAYEYLLKALAVNPKSPEVLGNLGIVLHERGRAEEALGYLDRAIELAPEPCLPHLESLSVLQTLDRPEALAGRLRSLPPHCLADPRVAEARQWLQRR